MAWERIKSESSLSRVLWTVEGIFAAELCAKLFIGSRCGWPFKPSPHHAHPPARGRAFTSNLNFSLVFFADRGHSQLSLPHIARGNYNFFFFFRRSKLFPARAKLLPRPNCLGFTSSIHPPPSRSSSSEHGRIIEVIYQGELIADCRARLGWAGDDNSNFAFFPRRRRRRRRCHGSISIMTD